MFESWITCVCFPHVISVYEFAYHIITDVHLTLWYIVFICPQDDVCENSIGIVYASGYCGLS